MSNETGAGQQFEAIWAEVKLLLEWQQGFGFFLVLGDDHRVSSRLQQRLHDFALARTRLFQSIKPASTESAVTDVLKAVFPTDADQKYADAKAPLWVDLMTEPDGSKWRLARERVLVALNQRRGALERNCLRPLLLHLPRTMAGDVVTWAPDLWSIRTFVAVLPSEQASGPFAPASARSLSIDLDTIGMAERDAGRLEAALSAFRESLELDRQLRQSLGDTPQALRDLSISLNRVGDAERDAGRLEAALSAFRESLELRRQLRQSLGDTPQALRDLSISLDQVGDAERDAGRLEAALSAFRESLELRRELRQSLGDTPQALRDLSISLDQMGKAERDAGRLEAALSAFRESLELRRQLRQSLGDTPQALRALSVSLDNVGNAERDAGRLEAALSAFRESLELCRQLRQSLGDTPQVLRDLRFVLTRLLNLLPADGVGSDLRDLRAELDAAEAAPSSH